MAALHLRCYEWYAYNRVNLIISPSLVFTESQMIQTGPKNSKRFGK